MLFPPCAQDVQCSTQQVGERCCCSEEQRECEQRIRTARSISILPRFGGVNDGFLQRFLQEEGGAGSCVASNNIGALEVFRSTVEVMLVDGVLTREEKRLIIKLASALNLEPSEPAEIYQSIQEKRPSGPGEQIEEGLFRKIYTQVFEVAIVNASLSKDEFRVLAHLRTQFNIDDEQHRDIERELREMVREKYEDNAMIDTLMTTLRDSVGMVGDLFDSIRKRPSDGEQR